MDNPYYEKLVNAALRFVSYRPRSERELRDFLGKKLKRWQVSGKLLTKRVIDRMRELGYVDDQKFANWWVDQRNTFNLKGARVISRELLLKGISREIIDGLLVSNKEAQEGFNESALARKAIAKKLVLWAKLPKIEQKKKVYTFLAQRGFSGDTIDAVIDEIAQKD